MKAFPIGLVAALLWAGTAFGQGAGTYVYVHKTLRDISRPPWLCVCYSVSRQSPIMSNLAQSQTWMVSRHNEWADAVDARNALSTGPNVCTYCSTPMAGGGPGGGAPPPPTPTVSLTVFVWGNCAGPRCIMGVAEDDYNEPGWSVISPPFRSHPDAWKYACALHAQGPYKAPDIEQGNITCGGSARRAIAAGRYKCSGGFGSVELAAAGSGELKGSYSSTWDKSAKGDIHIRLGGGGGSGTWNERKVGRAGVLTDITVESKGFKGRWSVKPGQGGTYRGRTLSENSGSFSCRK